MFACNGIASPKSMRHASCMGTGLQDIILEPSPHTYYLRVDPKQFFHNLGLAYAIHAMQSRACNLGHDNDDYDDDDDAGEDDDEDDDHDDNDVKCMHGLCVCTCVHDR